MLKKRVPQELVQNTLLNKEQIKSQETNTFQANDKKMNVSSNNIKLDTIPAFPGHKSATISLSDSATITVTEGVEIQSNDVTITNLDLSSVENGKNVVIVVNANSLQIDNIIMPGNANPNFSFHLKYYDENFVNGINDKYHIMQVKLPDIIYQINWFLYTTATDNDSISDPDSNKTNAVFVEPLYVDNNHHYDLSKSMLYFRNDSSQLSETGLDISTDESPLIGYIKVDPVDSETKIEEFSYDGTEYSVFLQTLKSGKRVIKAFTNEETEYTGPIYYPFRNDPGYDYEIHYYNDIIFDYPKTEKGSDSITIKEKKIVNKNNCIEIRINTRYFDYNQTGDYIDCDLLKRYNKNVLILSRENDDVTYEYEWPCHEWIINDSLIFDHDLCYVKNNLNSIIKLDNGIYHFSENKLIIEKNGSITLTNESMTTKEKKNRRATPLTMNAVGVNMIINGSIQCDKLIV